MFGFGWSDGVGVCMLPVVGIDGGRFIFLGNFAAHDSNYI